MQKIDNRLQCSDEKKSKIKMTKQATSLRRQHQVCKVYECKVVEKRLNAKQREELKMLFVEGKWFYNHELRLLKDGTFKDSDPLDIEHVIHLDKDKNEVNSML